MVISIQINPQNNLKDYQSIFLIKSVITMDNHSLLVTALVVHSLSSITLQKTFFRCYMIHIHALKQRKSHSGHSLDAQRLSGDAPFHISVFPNSTLTPRWNSTLLSFLNSAPLKSEPHSALNSELVRGHPISHSHQSELCSTPLSPLGLPWK